MSALGVRQVGYNSKRQVLQLMRWFLQAHILRHLLRIVITLLLLPLNNTILFVAVAIRYISSVFSLSASAARRHEILRDVRFHPKTILIAGLNSPEGLRIARCFYQEGHRVVGADITDSHLTAGEGMSRSLVAYYRVPKLQYVSKLLDIIQREKVDMWIPLSQDTSVTDDAMVKHAIEGRTGCKCIAFDAEIATRWSSAESFRQYLIENDLPIMERHNVQSRDSIHKILHRSPKKVYHMRRSAPGFKLDEIIDLPKRTLSLTYLEVSQLQISKDSPWIMEQHARLGEFLADVLMIRGHIAAMIVRPVDGESDWGYSPLTDGLSSSIEQIMNKFASMGGPRATGHLSVRLIVDEELDINSIRYVVYLAGCAQGAAAFTHLLQIKPPHTLVNGYLAMLSGVGVLLAMLDFTQRFNLVFDGPGEAFGQRFSIADPLPWWWHMHIYRPLSELHLMFSRKRY
ncbi:hypothetical protein BJX99DRAFT_246502 [Aspergillus californicus]